VASQSLRVPVAALVEKAEAERARILAEHAKLKADPPESIGHARLRLADELLELSRSIADGRKRPLADSVYDRRERRYRRALQVTVGVWLPEPLAKPDTAKVDRDLRLLRATSQATVSVRLDSDFARYV